MKKRIFGLVLALLLMLALAACSSASNPVDISEDLNCQIQNGGALIDRYDGNEKHVLIPDYLEGAKVTQIAQSFATGKIFDSVTLPERIQGCCFDENGQMVLTTYSDSGVVPINEKTAPWIYCSFFGTNSIQVNQVKYEYDVQTAVTDGNIVGEWTDGETLYTFAADGKITINAGSEHFEGTWQRQGSTVTMHMSEADFDDSDLDMEYCGGTLISWEYGAVLYQGKVPAEPEYNEGGNGGGGYGPVDEQISGDFVYTEVEGEVWLMKYIGTDPVVHIPTTVEGKPVTLLQLDCNDAIQELYIPANPQLKHVNGFMKTVGLQKVHWENIGSIDLLITLGYSIDELRELYLPGLTSINLNEMNDRILRQLTLLDISDCKEVIGNSLPTVTEGTLEVRVSQDIKYVQVPQEMHGELVLSDTKTANSIEITSDTWMEAWDMVFGGYTTFTVNGVQKTQDFEWFQTLIDTGWWSGYTSDGKANGKLLYLDERGNIYTGDMSAAPLQEAVLAMQGQDFDRLGLWYFGGQLWDVASNFVYLPMDWNEAIIAKWENPDGVATENGYQLVNLDTLDFKADGTVQVREVYYTTDGQEHVDRDETMTYVLEGSQITITAPGQEEIYAVLRLNRIDTEGLVLKVIGGTLDMGYLVYYTYPNN